MSARELAVAAAVASALEAFWATLYYRFPEATKHKLPNDIDAAFTFYATRTVETWLTAGGTDGAR